MGEFIQFAYVTGKASLIVDLEMLINLSVSIFFRSYVMEINLLLITDVAKTFQTQVCVVKTYHSLLWEHFFTFFLFNK